MIGPRSDELLWQPANDSHLRREFIVLGAPGWPGGIKPWPNTLERSKAFVACHGGVLKSRVVSDWEAVDA